MPQEKSVLYWHYAVSLTHRKVGLAAFLRTAQESHLHIYYTAHDPAALVITEVAALLGLAVMAWDGSAAEEPLQPWVWVGSHTRDESLHPKTVNHPQAMLCLAPGTTGIDPPPLPPKHHYYMTGMSW